MPAYHQMGYHSENLLLESELSNFRGAVLSPVNCEIERMTKKAEAYRQAGGEEVIFDPQLYYPRTAVQGLCKWPYFPDDFVTVDAASPRWWRDLADSIAGTAYQVHATGVCSPAFVPRSFSDAYYATMTEAWETMSEAVSFCGLDALQTVLVSLSDIADTSRVYAIASVLTRRDIRRAYLVFLNDTEPRREIADAESLTGAMLLIRTLEENGVSTLVGFSSSDVVLWKAAGASSCASGKFWNLRRFTPSRWDPDEGGGGQLAYWFEESLVASLRESDVLRVEQAGLLSEASMSNPYSQQILQTLQSARTERHAWVGLGWRQYLYWFCDIESRISSEEIGVRELLRAAEANWETLEDADILTEERRNDGRWLRFWRIALAEYARL